MTNRKRLIGALLAAAVLGVVAVGGVVLAQTPGPGSSGGSSQGAPGAGGSGIRGRVDGFLNQLAQNLNIDRPTLDNALKTTAKQQVDGAVAAGRLTQDQANQIKQRIDNGQTPFGIGGFGGFDHRGRHGPGGPGAAAGCASSVGNAVTSTLGISASDLKQARANGQTIAQIAQANGKTVDDVRNAVADAAKGCLDQQVQAGNLTQQQEQNILQRLQNGAISGPGGRHNRGGQNGQPPASSGASQ